MVIATLLQSTTYFSKAMAEQEDDPISDPNGDCTHELRYEPLGVVVSYLPWNFPMETLSFKMAPAHVTGCTLIVKPSPDTPLSTYLIGKICHDIGFPKGVTPEMLIYRGEIFGRVISLIEFQSDDQVLEMANDTEAGLS